jgi:hypothetical protein
VHQVGFIYKKRKVVERSFRNATLHYLAHLGDPGSDGRIILRWFVRKWNMWVWTGSSWLRIGTGGGHL